MWTRKWVGTTKVLTHCKNTLTNSNRHRMLATRSLLLRTSRVFSRHYLHSPTTPQRQQSSHPYVATSSPARSVASRVHSTTNAFKAVHVPMFSNTCTSPSLAFQNESFSFPEIYQYTTHYSNEVYVFFSTDDANVFAKLAHGPSVYNVMTL